MRRTSCCPACRVPLFDDRDGGLECPECGYTEPQGPAAKQKDSFADHFQKLKAAVDSAQTPSKIMDTIKTPALPHHPSRPFLTRKFLVQFECSDKPRWLVPDHHTCNLLRTLATSVGQSATEGPVPNVVVVIEQ